MAQHADAPRKRSASRGAGALITRLGGLMFAEASGTYLLVMPTTLIAALFSLQGATANPAAYWLTVGAAFGLFLTVGLYLFADASSAHFNPAVTLALVASGDFRALVAPFYVVAQLAGAVLGSLTAMLLLIATPGAQSSGYGVTQPADGFGAVKAGIVEFIGTAVLVGAISRVTDADPDLKPVSRTVIGLTLGVLVLCFGPISGGAFNPARLLAPMLMSGQWGDWFVYLPAELLGAVAGRFAYARIVARTKPVG